VRNKSAPEGSIAEGYVSRELVSFLLMYLDNASTVHNRPQRNLDEAKGAITRVNLDNRTLAQVHRYILFNSDEFLQLRR
jgi:hypothetical protein